MIIGSEIPGPPEKLAPLIPPPTPPQEKAPVADPYIVTIGPPLQPVSRNDADSFRHAGHARHAGQSVLGCQGGHRHGDAQVGGTGCAPTGRRGR